MNKVKRIESTFEFLRIVVSFLIAYGFTLLILLLISKDPGNAIYSFVVGPFSSINKMGRIVQKAIPLIFTGLGMCFMYSVNRFNVVGEGIFIASACMTTYVALLLEKFNLPTAVYIPVLLLVGAVVGAAVAFIPAIINAKLNANIIVLSIMMNYILLFFTQFILTRVVRDVSVSYTASYAIPKTAQFGDLIRRTGIHSGIFVALACYLLVVILYRKTSFGYTMCVVGSNPDFSRHAGIGVISTIVLAQVFGGVLAGLGGAVEQLGMNARFQWTELTNHGMNGVVVAVLAKKKPSMVIIAAFLLAYIKQGAEIVNSSSDIPAEFVVVVQGIIILLVAAEMFLSSYRNRLIFKQAIKG